MAVAVAVMDELFEGAPKPADPVRDGRYRSRMDADTKLVDALLARWGKWCRAGLSHLGLPRQAVIAQVTGRSTAPTDMPDDILAVERAVLTLKAIQRRVLAEHYCYWQPAEVSARWCHMSPERFRKLLHEGRKEVRKQLLAA